MTLYREEILYHYKEPLNYGRINNPTHTSYEKNLFCGDEIHMDLIIKDGVVEDIKHHSLGCALSVASASILSDAIKGKPIEFVYKISESEVLGWINSDITTSRVKCVLLPFRCLKSIIGNR